MYARISNLMSYVLSWNSGAQAGETDGWMDRQTEQLQNIVVNIKMKKSKLGVVAH